MSIVEFKKVTKRFGQVTILNEVDLSIEPGEKVVLIGPSGSGKSTLLRCINALEEINGGDLVVDGISVKAGGRMVRLIRQEAGMVFQQFNLFPQMTALENVAFGRAACAASHGRMRKSWRWKCSPRSASPTGLTTIRASFPAASSNVSRSPARLPSSRS